MENHQLSLLRAHVEIRSSDIGSDRYERPIVSIFESLRVSSTCLELPAELADQIKFPAGVEAAGFSDARETLGVCRRPSGCDTRPPPCLVRVLFRRPPPPVALDNRKLLTDRDRDPCPRFLQPIKSDCEIKVGFAGARDQRVQLAIVQHPPPLGQISARTPCRMQPLFPRPARDNPAAGMSTAFDSLALRRSRPM